MEDALTSVTQFIDIVYLKNRRHSALGYVLPEEFEAVGKQNHIIPEPQKVKRLAA